VIVSDADHALARAVQTVFGDAGVEHRLCEWHLGRKLRYHLPDEILADPQHPITRAVPSAFYSPQAWATLERAIHDEHENRPLKLAVKWLETYGPIAAAHSHISIRIE
jgi:ABC-type oligopeptide transport system ATPase subunit